MIKGVKIIPLRTFSDNQEKVMYMIRSIDVFSLTDYWKNEETK